MKRIVHILIIAVMCLGLSSCAEEEPEAEPILAVGCYYLNGDTDEEYIEVISDTEINISNCDNEEVINLIVTGYETENPDRTESEVLAFQKQLEELLSATYECKLQSDNGKVEICIYNLDGTNSTALTMSYSDSQKMILRAGKEYFWVDES